MIVEELIEQLKRYPADMPVYVNQWGYDVEEQEPYPINANPKLIISSGCGATHLLIDGEL